MSRRRLYSTCTLSQIRLLRALSLVVLLPAVHAATPTATPTAARPSTLVLQQSSDVSSLDPAQAYDAPSFGVIENLYETLTTYVGSDLRAVRPLLATAWSTSADGRAYTVTLRRNVHFHSGNLFTCADAEYSLRRLLVTNNADSGNFFVAKALLGSEDNAKSNPAVTWEAITRAVSCDAAGHLALRLPAPDPALMSKLSSQNTSIIDRKWNVALGDWDGTERTWKLFVGRDLTDSPLSRTPSGTGAYRLLKRDASSILATAFAGYWGGAPKIQNVVQQLIPEQAARLLALKRGDADVIEVSSRAQLTALNTAQGVTVLDGLPALGTPLVLFNQRIQNPDLLGSARLDEYGIPATFFRDVDVRRAFSYAFDDHTYVNEVTGGAAERRVMALPPSFLGYSGSVPAYSFDRAKAVRAFRAAYGGRLWKTGFTLSVTYRAGARDSQSVAELIKREVEAINPRFHVTVRSELWSTLLADSKAGRTAMLLISWGADYADPDNVLSALYASDGFYAARTGFADAKIDALLTSGRTLTDPRARETVYRQVAVRAYKLAPYILLPASPSYVAHSSVLRGLDRVSYNPMLAGLAGVYWRQLSK